MIRLFSFFVLFFLFSCTQPLELKPDRNGLTLEELKDRAVDVSNLGNQVLLEDQDPIILPFTVRGNESDPSKLVVKAISSNKDVVPDPHVEFQREAGIFTVEVASNKEAFGDALIKVIVYNGYSSQEKIFKVFVQAVNDPPQIQGPTRLELKAGKKYEPTLEIWVNDVESSENEITTRVRSTQTSAFPEGSLKIEGDGKKRKLLITEPPSHPGKFYLVVEARDPEGVEGRHEIETIVDFGAPSPPLVQGLPDRLKVSTLKGHPKLKFTVMDTDTLPPGLSVNVELENNSLISPSNIFLGSQDADRTLEIKPSKSHPLKVGATSLVLKVSDGNSTVDQKIFLDIVDEK